jgi:hypothetical protein
MARDNGHGCGDRQDFQRPVTNSSTRIRGCGILAVARVIRPSRVNNLLEKPSKTQNPPLRAGLHVGLMDGTL